jgi:hypothetical protein
VSFEETKQGFFWTCDRCGLVAEFPPAGFWRALDELKARGWEISRLQDEDGYSWSHCCAKCRKTSAEILSMPVIGKARRS